MNDAQKVVELQATNDQPPHETDPGSLDRITTSRLLDEVEAFDPTAVEEILERYRVRLKQIVAQQFDSRLQARIDASDVVQEVLVEAARRLPKYARERPVGFLSWLKAIAKQQLAHLRVHHLHRTKRSVLREQTTNRVDETDSGLSSIADLSADPSDSPEGQAMQRETERLLCAAIDQLPDHEKDVVFLRFFARVPARNVAEALNLSESAVHMRQLRAIQHLRKMLQLDLAE